jgi:membrane fusion protein (multidrug efflux system)
VAEIAGRVAALEVDEGDRVEAGQVVARIENVDAALATRQAQQNVERYRRERDALLPLYEQGYLSRQAFEETDFQLRSAEMELERSRTTAGTQVIRAATAAAVTSRLVNRGEIVVPNQSLFVLSTVDALQAQIAVPERELSVLREGQPAQLLFDALPGVPVTGRIDRIHPVVDPTSGTVQVRLAVDTPVDAVDVRLRPGMFATVRIVTDVHTGVVAVPKRALLYEADTPYVFVIGEEYVPPPVEGSADAGSEGELAEADGSSADADAGPRYRVERVALTLGYEDPNHVEVVSGVSAGSRVVVTGQSGLDPSSVVTVSTGVSQTAPSDAPPAATSASATVPGSEITEGSGSTDASGAP